jgi:ATP-dependent DNA ligase
MPTLECPSYSLTTGQADAPAAARSRKLVACGHDLEGIVGKLASGRYHADGTSTNWCKIKNPAYTQMTARHELFNRAGPRKRNPRLCVP